jgi:hypothetical protein
MADGLFNRLHQQSQPDYFYLFVATRYTRINVSTAPANPSYRAKFSGGWLQATGPMPAEVTETRNCRDSAVAGVHPSHFDRYKHDIQLLWDRYNRLYVQFREKSCS